MSLGDEIKLIRQKSLLTQGAFADELHVALSTVNRWEKGKARPNLSTMKTIKWFCESKRKDESTYAKTEMIVNF